MYNTPPQNGVPPLRKFKKNEKLWKSCDLTNSDEEFLENGVYFQVMSHDSNSGPVETLLADPPSHLFLFTWRPLHATPRHNVQIKIREGWHRKLAPYSTMHDQILRCVVEPTRFKSKYGAAKPCGRNFQIGNHQNSQE